MPVTNFVWDRVSDNVLMEVDDGGNTVAEYSNEPGLYGELISQRRNEKNSYFHFDAHESTRQLTTDSQEVSDRYTYSAFGEQLAASGSTFNPYRFNSKSGYRLESETFNYAVKERTYSPQIARWLTAEMNALGDATGCAPIYAYTFRWASQSKKSKGDVDITWEFDNFSTATCGQKAYMRWTFGIKDKDGAPCTGYLIQRVEWFCSVAECVDCKYDMPKNPSLTFYEACYITLGKKKCKFSSGTDRFGFNVLWGTCGALSIRAEMRFYCLADRFGKQGTGDLGGRRKWDDPKKPWKNGPVKLPRQCGGGKVETGHWLILPDSIYATNWWGTNDPIGQPATHSIDVRWTCCPIGPIQMPLCFGSGKPSRPPGPIDDPFEPK